jgi:cytidylate kinase
MRCSADRLIEALIATEMIAMQQREAKKKEALRKKSDPFVVTVSRDFGSLGKKVGQLLADTLEVRCCDRFILQEVARRAHVDEVLVKALDEHVSKIDGHWWQRLLHKDTLSYDDYYHYLVKTVLSISRTGGVIIGRGANLILGPKKAFHIRITGSIDKCAERVANRDNIGIKESIELVKKVNKERADYIKMLYQADINDNSQYDLILNSDRYDLVQMVELILDAMEKAGYKLPDDARDSVSILAEKNRIETGGKK